MEIIFKLTIALILLCIPTIQLDSNIFDPNCFVNSRIHKFCPYSPPESELVPKQIVPLATAQGLNQLALEQLALPVIVEEGQDIVSPVDNISRGRGPKKVPKLFKCDNLVYDPNKSICCKNQIFPIVDGKSLCCGNRPFNLNRETCCRARLWPKQLDKQFCCGNTPFNHNKEMCCDQHLVSKVRHRTKCCGIRAFNPQVNSCCMGKIINKEPGKTRCCKDITYDPKMHSCNSDGDLVRISSTNEQDEGNDEQQEEGSASTKKEEEEEDIVSPF